VFDAIVATGVSARQRQIPIRSDVARRTGNGQGRHGRLCQTKPIRRGTGGGRRGIGFVFPPPLPCRMHHNSFPIRHLPFISSPANWVRFARSIVKRVGRTRRRSSLVVRSNAARRPRSTGVPPVIPGACRVRSDAVRRYLYKHRLARGMQGTVRRGESPFAPSIGRMRETADKPSPAFGRNQERLSLCRVPAERGPTWASL